MFSSFKNTAASLTKRPLFSNKTKSALIAAATIAPAALTIGWCLSLQAPANITSFLLLAAPVLPSLGFNLASAFGSEPDRENPSYHKKNRRSAQFSSTANWLSTLMFSGVFLIGLNGTLTYPKLAIFGIGGMTLGGFGAYYFAKDAVKDWKEATEIFTKPQGPVRTLFSSTSLNDYKRHSHDK